MNSVKDALEACSYFPAALCLGCYLLAKWIASRIRDPLKAAAHPLILAVAAVIGTLMLTGFDYQSFSEISAPISYLVTPATVCLAVPLCEHLSELKRYPAAIVCAVSCGVITSAVCVWGMSVLFRLTKAEYLTLLPKSVTSAIGLALAEQFEAYVPITLSAIIISGLVGALAAPHLMRLFGIRHPAALGLALGSACGVLGSVRAKELGKLEEATANLAIVISGLLTVLAADLFAHLPI